MTILKPSVLRYGGLDMQVCVPKDWDNDEVIAYAQRKYPSGTTNGWSIRREGDPSLSGDPERNPCGRNKEEMVHITLDA